MASVTEAGWALSASLAANPGVDVGTTRCRCAALAEVRLLVRHRMDSPWRA